MYGRMLTAQTESAALQDDELAELQDQLFELETEFSHLVGICVEVSNTVIRTEQTCAARLLRGRLSERWTFSDLLYAYCNMQLFEDERGRVAKLCNATRRQIEQHLTEQES
jgi:hypothetical protein